MDPIIGLGLAASVVIAVVVQVLKATGLVGLSQAPWVTLVACIVVVGVGLVLQQFPEAQRYVDALIAALLLFLGSTGSYHVGKNIAVDLGASTGKPSVSERPQ